MAENVQRSRGRPQNYKLDRGGVPAEGGPFLGIVMSNVDPIRQGRLRVYIEAFADGKSSDETKWTTVSYLPPFFGYTPLQPGGVNDKVGEFTQNQNSYGMWFTPPDVGVTVLCVFVNGDRSQGYYIGVVPSSGIGYMVPAIGSAPAGQYKIPPTNSNQQQYFAGAPQLPVTEINVNNLQAFNNPRYFEQPKPVQSYVAATIWQQGLIQDTERGPITSSSMRETPSSVFGISTPGTPIYQGGMKPSDIKQKVDSGAIKPNQAQVIGRIGGHTLVMDDGDQEGNNALVRLRTSKGHQITMNDTGDFFYIIHANGQTWLEFGAEGTVDVFSTNSINLRTQGDINLHADRDINMFAGRDVSIKSTGMMQLESLTELTIQSQDTATFYSQATINVKSDGTLALDSAGGSWAAGDSCVISADGIDLNGPAAPAVEAPNPITKTLLDDVSFSSSTGWQVNPEALESIVSRAPTHEPYPYHNLGVDVEVTLEESPTPPPGAVPVPPGVVIEAEA